MKKCIITGHTSGIGQYLFEYYATKGWLVKGMSRSNGYDIVADRNQIVSEAEQCDLFINNASSGTGQLELLKTLCTKVPKIVTLGSTGSDYTDVWGKQYTWDKKQLEEAARYIQINPRSDLADMLLLKISFAETTYNRIKQNRIDSDCTTSYNEIATAIDFWLSNPSVRLIEFRFKLTDYTVARAKEVVANPELINVLLDKSNDLISG